MSDKEVINNIIIQTKKNDIKWVLSKQHTKDILTSYIKLTDKKKLEVRLTRYKYFDKEFGLIDSLNMYVEFFIHKESDFNPHSTDTINIQGCKEIFYLFSIVYYNLIEEEFINKLEKLYDKMRWLRGYNKGNKFFSSYIMKKDDQVLLVEITSKKVGIKYLNSKTGEEFFIKSIKNTSLFDIMMSRK
ncbi:MAG: hypothetical protein KDH96_13505 [Candidatus Riesia sp.]|nr:hypothetical protein [Candidatus Riesia sp.]